MQGGINTFFKKNIGGWISKNPRFVWAIIFTVITFLVLNFSYFEQYQVAGVHFLGESIISSFVFLFVFLFGKSLVSFVSLWIEGMIERIFKSVLYDFWVNQSAKVVEIVRRQNARVLEDPSSFDEFHRPVPPIVLDTSSIIDGRILGLMRTSFLYNTIIVTQSVIEELKRIADKETSAKKDRGKRGLDILYEIKKLAGKNRFKTIDTNFTYKNGNTVDQSLIDFCVEKKAKIATLDMNLSKAADLSGVKVLNINKLVTEIRMNLRPGDLVNIKLMQQGKESGQTIGYLDDGTMIVVRDSFDHLGETHDVLVEKVIQTEAGKLIFVFFL